MNHSEGTENLALAEAFERFIGDAFQSNTQDDEPDVAVNGARAGIRGERDCEGRMQKFFWGVCLQEQLFIGGQARTVSQEHAQRDFFPSFIIAPAEFRNNGNYRRLEVE